MLCLILHYNRTSFGDNWSKIFTAISVAKLKQWSE